MGTHKAEMHIRCPSNFVEDTFCVMQTRNSNSNSKTWCVLTTNVMSVQTHRLHQWPCSKPWIYTCTSQTQECCARLMNIVVFQCVGDERVRRSNRGWRNWTWQKEEAVAFAGSCAHSEPQRLRATNSGQMPIRVWTDCLQSVDGNSGSGCFATIARFRALVTHTKYSVETWLWLSYLPRTGTLIFDNVAFITEWYWWE